MIRRLGAWIVCVVLFVIAAGLVADALAQGEEAAPAAQPAASGGTAPTPAPQGVRLWDMIKQGGPTMIFLGLCSIAAVALIIRNFIYLQERKLLRPEIWPSLEAAMLERDIDQARSICATQPCMLTDVLDAGLSRITTDTVEAETIEKAIEEKGTEQTTAMMTPINYLSLVGVVSPMLGLLGTVLGMIGAFQHISMGAMGKPELLAADIGEALITTATGLIIGIPAMGFFLYFKNSFLRIASRMGLIVGGLLDALHSERGAEGEAWEVE